MQADDLLPPTSPCLGSLQKLTLACGVLKAFLESLATELGHLRHLCLSSNEFVRIPAAVSCIKTLKTISFSSSHLLQLHNGDVDVLRALPHLECLELSRELDDGTEESGFSQNSLGVIIQLGRALPNVHLSGFGYLSDDE